MTANILVSFVHGYHSDDILVNKNDLPCLALVNTKARSLLDIKGLYFPRSPEDFYNKDFSGLVIGDFPERKMTPAFKKLPRFGVMGLAKNKTYIFAATWNGVYKLRRPDLSICGFLTNKLISDPHGIDVKNGVLYSVLTALDMVVLTDIETGAVVDYFSINRKLQIERNNDVEEFDWRFITKQHRGAVGNWHFNHITVDADIIRLTSRLASCLVEVDLKTEEATLRTVCWDTPVMIHDGRVMHNGDIVFTSVDGKILIANKPENIGSSITSMSDLHFHKMMQRDLVNVSIRINEIEERTVNWCRGIEECDGEYVTTTDGRHDQHRPFFCVSFVHKKTARIEHIQIGYENLEFPEGLRYMTGFSVLKIGSDSVSGAETF